MLELNKLKKKKKMLNYQKKKQDVPELINKTSKEGIKYEHQVQRKRSIP